MYKKFKKFFDREEQEKEIKRTFGDDYVDKSKKQAKIDDAQLFKQRVEEFKKLKSQGLIDMNAWRKEQAKELKEMKRRG